jgi:hypothetical protein
MLMIGFGYKAGLLIEGIGLSKGLREPNGIAGQAHSHAGLAWEQACPAIRLGRISG